MQRTVSVVVAARDAAATLPASLRSVAQLTYPAVETIVVDDGSRDATAEIARASGARVIAAHGAGPAAARNLGVAHAAGELVAFTDADCEVPREWLSTLVAALDQPEVASAGGPQRNVFPAAGDGRVNEAIDAFFRLSGLVADYTRHDDRPRDVRHNASCNVLYRREVFREVGGFVPGLFPGEDVELDRRLTARGYRLRYDPRAVVVHHRPGGMAWFRRMMRRYGRGQGVVVRMHGPFRPIDAVPPALLTVVLAQALTLSSRARPVVLALDAALAGLSATLVATHVPPHLWLDVARCAGVALAEWHRGYFEGLRDGPPPAWRRRTGAGGRGTQDLLDTHSDDAATC